uniref:chemotaxis protein n=1 Tax=Roseivirga sp. TaxID=1964215 RepID=UPI004047113D
MKFLDKVKWILGISVVFFSILATNLIDRMSFKRVKDSVVAIYEDRLVAKDLVFELSLLIHEKEVAQASNDTRFFSDRNAAVNDSIEQLTIRFIRTELTEKEARVFNDLQLNLVKLKGLENSMTLAQEVEQGDFKSQLLEIKENLHDLSKIQLVEGKRQVFLSERAMDTVDLFTKLEILVLIILAVLVQIIVIYRPKQSRD